MAENPSSKTIIWDWNGTLLDDLDICIKGINVYLKERDLNTLDNNGYREIFGFPIGDYYQKIGFDFKKDSLEDLSSKFIATYFENFDQTKLSDGTREVLEKFQKAGYQQYILSAMDQNSLENSVKKFGITKYFKIIRGAQDKLAYGKIDYGEKLFTELKLNPESTCFIGDTTHDKEIADSLNAHCVLFSGGHQSYERLATNNTIVVNELIDSFGAVEKILK